MVLKRKRSDSDMSAASSSINSSPPRMNSMDTLHVPLIQFQPLSDGIPSHLSSRTRKRFRDNRPSEAIVHEHTLSLLFSAQRNPQPYQTPQIPIAIPVMINDHTHQPSLHSFWTLPSQPSSSIPGNESASSQLSNDAYQVANCEDCDASLISANGDAMDIDMDIDMYCGSSNYSCSRCGKQVCHQCAISNLGSQRRCLICAGKRMWVGGIGWVRQD